MQQSQDHRNKTISRKVPLRTACFLLTVTHRILALLDIPLRMDALKCLKIKQNLAENTRLLKTACVTRSTCSAAQMPRSPTSTRNNRMQIFHTWGFLMLRMFRILFFLEPSFPLLLRKAWDIKRKSHQSLSQTTLFRACGPIHHQSQIS